MRRFYAVLLGALIALSACGKKADNKAYLFYSDNCSHCHQAMKYMDQNYKNLNLIRVNVNNPEGLEKLYACAKKFDLGRRVGTPLFCFPDHYIMGWSQESRRLFDEYIKPFAE